MTPPMLPPFLTAVREIIAGGAMWVRSGLWIVGDARPCGNFLRAPLPDGNADVVVSTFGLKTFNAEQHGILTQQVKRLLKPGGAFSWIEASDPKGWIGRPFYRFYMDRVIPLVEKLFLKGAEDFSMVGPYSKRFGNCEGFAQAMRDVGLEVTYRRHFFGCATSVSGRKPVA
ncbi:MAG: class I SAM-dependent methyltransferase [Octadecabacter sp.]|nr:class I SAM-dependent methyltransferase [Octadecabacter sp.]